MIKGNKFRKGAASFYIVAFSTLILLIVATSFAAVIISEVERTSNDDLSQSAYDSAMAGIEDGKLAFYSYQNCKAQRGSEAEGGDPTCRTIIEPLMETPDCYMVGRTLSRIGLNDETEVKIKESTDAGGDNNMEQAYTCVKVNTILENYKSTLSSATQTKVVKLKFADEVAAADIKTVKVSWYSDEDKTNYRYENLKNNNVTFPSANMSLTAIPPTISVSLVQTAKDFTFDQFDTTHGSQTDRGMVYLVPTDQLGYASSVKDGNHLAGYNSSKGGNYIGSSGFSDSNKKTPTNLPYAVYCPKNSGQSFACSATIELPNPVGGTRNDDTFLIAVSIPYGKPTTSFMLEFGCNGACWTEQVKKENGEVVTENRELARLDSVQIEIDSTGRANDLYRRIEARLESAGNDGNLLTMGPLELSGKSTDDGGENSSGGDGALTKKMTVKCENNFVDPSNCSRP